MVVAAVNDIETLVYDLARKIWQKIVILGPVGRDAGGLTTEADASSSNP